MLRKTKEEKKKKNVKNSREIETVVLREDLKHLHKACIEVKNPFVLLYNTSKSKKRYHQSSKRIGNASQ
jgi:hypothetical protein